MGAARRSIDELIDLVDADEALSDNYELRIAVAKVKAALHELEGAVKKPRRFAQPRVVRA